MYFLQSIYFQRGRENIKSLSNYKYIYNHKFIIYHFLTISTINIGFIYFREKNQNFRVIMKNGYSEARLIFRRTNPNNSHGCYIVITCILG